MDFLLGNKYLAIIKWVAIAGAVWYIFHTWDKAQNYDAIKAQLDNEKSCAVTSVCSERAYKQSEESKAAVKAVQDAADEQNRKTKAEHDAQEQAATDAHKEMVKQLQGKLTERDKKLSEVALHDKPCANWLNEVIPECVL